MKLLPLLFILLTSVIASEAQITFYIGSGYGQFSSDVLLDISSAGKQDIQFSTNAIDKTNHVNSGHAPLSFSLGMGDGLEAGINFQTTVKPQIFSFSYMGSDLIAYEEAFKRTDLGFYLRYNFLHSSWKSAGDIGPFVSASVGKKWLKKEIVTNENQILMEPDLRDIKSTMFLTANAGLTWNMFDSVMLELQGSYFVIDDFQLENYINKTRLEHFSVTLGIRFFFEMDDTILHPCRLW